MSEIRILDFGIANFRSFDPDGIVIEDFGKINVFIGKNNSGKSNILRFIKLFSESYSAGDPKFPNALENQFRRNDKSAELIVSIEKDSFLDGTTVHPNQLPEEKLTFRIDLQTRRMSGHSPLEKLNLQQLHKFQTRFAESQNLSELSKQVNNEVVARLLGALNFFQKLIYVPDFREIKETSSNQEGIQNVNGDNVIALLHEMQHPNLGNESAQEKFDKIQSLVGELLGVKDLVIEIPFDKSQLILKMYGNRLALESFGSGVHELVILCSALAIYDDHIVCIEEPEIHMHPELQRKLMEFASSTNNRYFITTHSNVFLDSISGLNIYHVTYDGESSKVVKAKTNLRTYEILNDLAYKASDLLQSNGIIWVEGPSDRVYLNKWLSLIEPTFIEGIHYLVMFYGGRLLSHLTMKSDDIEQELIPLLRINRNAIVIIDRDGFTSGSKLNRTKVRINKETKERNCWITQGREIENYLTQRTIESYLGDQFNLDTQFQYDPDKKIRETLRKIAFETVGFDYDNDKPKYAKEIIDFISDEDLDILDLRKRLSHVVKSINEWNYSSIAYQ